MPETPVAFTSEGARCAGILGLPDDLAPGERRAAVAFCHGFSLIKEIWLLESARRLRAAGYVTLNFDYRHFGESGGEPRQRLVPLEQVADIGNAVTFLEHHPSVLPDRIGLYGTSYGAGNASYAAGVDDRVRATVAVAGPGDCERVYRGPGFDEFLAKLVAARARFVTTGEVTSLSTIRLMQKDPGTARKLEATAKEFPHWRPEITFESLLDVVRFRPESVVDRIDPRAILWIHPEKDGLVPLFEAQSLFAKARGKNRKLVVLEGREHVDIYDGPGRDAVLQHALAFYAEHLPARA